MSNTTINLKHLELEDLHIEAGAKFGNFAGWYMPLTYPLGVMKEHLHTRESAGLFDISHMKLFIASGDEVCEFLTYALPIDAASFNLSQSRYCYLLAEDAGILDDLIVTRLEDKRFVIAANAGNAIADLEELSLRAKNYNVHLEALDRVFLAIQGPKAADVLRDLGFEVDKLVFMQAIEYEADKLIARSGYTGEDGFEIAVPLAEGHDLAKAIIKDERVEWIGLAARDSLRLESGLCLHGQDITKEINPIEAGLTFAVPKSVREKACFIGAKAFNDALANGVNKKRVGLKANSNQPVRSQAELFDKDDNRVGIVTSGGYGPSVGAPVAMGYVDIAHSEIGTELFAKVRDRKISVTVHKLPFIQQNYFKG